MAVSAKHWKKIKELVLAGWKLVDIEKLFRGEVTAAQISARKQIWQRKDYFTSSKYAKFQTKEYVEWRTAVLTRDKYRCIICERSKPEVKYLQADHVKAWSKYHNERFNVANGRTLCGRCHKRTLNYGRKAIDYVNDPISEATWVRDEKKKWKMEKLIKDLKKQTNARKPNTKTNKSSNRKTK